MMYTLHQHGHFFTNHYFTIYMQQKGSITKVNPFDLAL